jgi:hypothetical protein
MASTSPRLRRHPRPVAHNAIDPREPGNWLLCRASLVGSADHWPRPALHCPYYFARCHCCKAHWSFSLSEHGTDLLGSAPLLAGVLDRSTTITTVPFKTQLKWEWCFPINLFHNVHVFQTFDKAVKHAWGGEVRHKKTFCSPMEWIIFSPESYVFPVKSNCLLRNFCMLLVKSVHYKEGLSFQTVHYRCASYSQFEVRSYPHEGRPTLITSLYVRAERKTF